MQAQSQKPRDERWSRYPETVLIFAGDPEVYIDLREPVPPATKKAMKAIGLGEPFGVLTAFNPRGQDVDEEENAKRSEELENELTSSGDEFVRVDACAPDRAHCECSVALKAPRARVVDIAKRWEQIAIFWWDGSNFWIEGAISDADPMQLPVGLPDK
ncbi:MAG TPA: DUF3293 domain-containing protein [Gemmatimonadaceae bacterium]|nr:DUF3293 domain-containing protein [Gemmatimonadaceae bacterium]